MQSGDPGWTRHMTETPDIRQQLDGLVVLSRKLLEHGPCGKSLAAVEELVVDWSPLAGKPPGRLIRVCWALEPFELDRIDSVANPVFSALLNASAMQRAVTSFEQVAETGWIDVARRDIAQAFDEHWGFGRVAGLFTGLRHR